jgi:hypothetical protein
MRGGGERNNNTNRIAMSKKITFYFDKDSDVVSLHNHDRTCKNQLAEGIGESIGMLVTMLINEINRLPNSGSISITVEKDK